MAHKLVSYITKYTSPNQSVGFDAQSITIHWWGTPSSHRSGKIGGVVSWLCNPAARASAHFVASGVTADLACIISLNRRAWHSANSTGNRTSAAVEMHPWDSKTPASQRQADMNLAAYVVALTWYWKPKTKGKQLKGHKDWFNTACPGYYYPELDTIFQRATKLYPYVLPDRPGWIAEGGPITKLTDTFRTTPPGKDELDMDEKDVRRIIREELNRKLDNLVPRPENSDSKDPEWSLGNSIKYLLDHVMTIRKKIG